MPHVTTIGPLLSPCVTLAVLVLGTVIVHVLDAVLAGAISGRRTAFLDPLRRAALLLVQRATVTERPDALLWVLAPAIYAAVAAIALCVVPLGEGVAIADVRTGIVLFGAAEALAIVAIFLHGWSSNSHLSLLGGYRFVALGLSYELLSMFVLIAAALPAESLQVSAIVSSQSDLWNVVRQPLGLPLWIVVMLGVTFWGPLDLADAADLGGGTSLETSGRQRLLWQGARGAMLTVMAGMGAAVFLGGPLGPGLPGWAYMLLKTLVLLVLVLGVGHLVGRVQSEKAMRVLWTIGLPIAFVHLLLAGVEALL